MARHRVADPARLAAAAGLDEAAVRGALRRHHGDPVAALEALGVPLVAAEAAALAARTTSPATPARPGQRRVAAGRAARASSAGAAARSSGDPAAVRLADLRRRWVAAVQAEAAPRATAAERRQAHGRRQRLERELRAVERAVRQGEPLPSTREVLGHFRRGEGPPRFRIRLFLGDPARTVIGELGLRDVRRAGRYLAALHALAAGQRFEGRPMTGERFRTLVSGWAPVSVLGPEGEAGRHRLLALPGAALVLLDRLRVEGDDLVSYAKLGRRR